MKGRVLLRVTVLVAFQATLIAWTADRLLPGPSADVARGSEEAFASGLFPRELRPRLPPLRWTSPQAVFHFRFLPLGPRHLEVRIGDHRGRVLVRAGGDAVGALEPGSHALDVDLPESGSTLSVELVTEGFVAGGRRLGAALERVAVSIPRRAFPPGGLLACFLVPALIVGWAGTVSGLPEPLAILLAGGVSLFEGLALHPSGVLLSDEAILLGGILACGALLAALVARRAPLSVECGLSGPAWAFVALLVAVVVHGAAATSPLMVVSDAVFQANKVRAVAGGDFFPTSETQHIPPFRFPYGVSFFALLAPLLRLGLDPVGLVRWGAALSGLLASAALFYLVAPRGVAWAGLSVLLLQLLPGSFDLFSYGNLSNVFAQSATVLFFAWWAGEAAGGPALGALFLVIAGLGHFSSFLVLAVLGPALVLLGGHDLRQDRPRAFALLGGLALSSLYYLSFVPLAWAQLGRLGEGGGGAARAGLVFALGAQGRAALLQWGPPVLLLALYGWPRRSEGPFEKDLTAFWAAGGILAVLAVASPLDVRYLYALSIPLAIAAGRGAARLLGSEGVLPRVALALLVAAQTALAARELVFDILVRYRSAL
jgi:hypothetical protein